MQLVTCIDKGLAHTQATLEEVARDVVELRLVYSTLDPTSARPAAAVLTSTRSSSGTGLRPRPSTTTWRA